MNMHELVQRSCVSDRPPQSPVRPLAVQTTLIYNILSVPQGRGRAAVRVVVVMVRPWFGNARRKRLSDETRDPR